MSFLIESRHLDGINAPLFAWLAAVGLLLAALVATTTLAIHVHKLRASEKALSASLTKLSTPTFGNGLSLAEIEKIRQRFAGFPLYARSWTKLQNKTIRRAGPKGDEYWLSVPASEILAHSSVTDVYINRELYEAIPGILTGLGLLCTFVAILIALLHVGFNETTHRVEGMALLIEGLSGKFISSIAALLAATSFTFFEKHQLPKLDRSVHDLSDAVGAVIPVLTPTHLLVELQRDMGEQSVAFRTFNADLSGRLKQSFSESMGPTLERMVTAVEDLNQLLRSAEAAKSDTISESLAGMISRLSCFIRATEAYRLRSTVSTSAREHRKLPR